MSIIGMMLPEYLERLLRLLRADRERAEGGLAGLPRRGFDLTHEHGRPRKLATFNSEGHFLKGARHCGCSVAHFPDCIANTSTAPENGTQVDEYKTLYQGEGRSNH